MKLPTRLLSMMAALGLATGAEAGMFQILSVQGCSGGFCASLFHDASGSNPMSGATLAEITGIATAPGVGNTYDDQSGAFDAVFSVSDGSAGGTVHLQGQLDFPAAPGGGLLAGVSSLTADFEGAVATGLADTTLHFDTGYQCCGSDGFDPNSFLPSAAPFPQGPDVMLMTLWGANGWNGNAWPAASLGIDLRVLMQALPRTLPNLPVPEPGAPALLLLGLAAAGMARRAGRGSPAR